MLIILLLCLLQKNVFASSCEHRQTSLVVENDSALTLGGGTDRFYSNGLEISYRCQHDTNAKEYQPNLAHRSLKWFTSDVDIFRVNRGLKIGQKVFTSSDLSLQPEEIDINRDRPYAGWSYVSIFFEAETILDRYIKHEFSVGCVGPCSQAEEIQTEWHELFGFIEPQGWDLQINNLLVLQYFLEYKTNRHQIIPNVSLHPRYKLSLGTAFNDISFGGEFIIGDESNETINKPTYKYKKWEWQAFIHNDIKLVAYNATLEGSMFNDNSPHKVSPSRVLLENGLGIRLKYNDKYSFEYRFVGKSTENEEQSWKFWDHKYGSFEFGFGF